MQIHCETQERMLAQAEALHQILLISKSCSTCTTHECFVDDLVAHTDLCRLLNHQLQVLMPHHDDVHRAVVHHCVGIYEMVRGSDGFPHDVRYEINCNICELDCL